MLTYESLDTIEPGDCTAKPSGRRTECPRCEKLFADGAIVNEVPLWCPERRAYTMTRRLYCDHCKTLYTWIETATEAGKPLGVRLNRPCRFTAASVINAFLKAHPEAAGVHQ